MQNILNKGFLSFIQSFTKEQSGSIMVYAALAMIPIVGFTGLAIDTARGYMVRSHLSESLDAASLAAGRAVTENEIQEDVTRFFDLNFQSGYMGAVLEGPTATFNSDTNEITVSASATIHTTFMSIFGEDNLTVSTSTKIQRNVRGMELTLVMDNTGSMRGSGKIGAMKTAAHDLIDILYGDEETIDDFWVALVPYTATVNVGNNYFAWLQGYDPDDFSPTTWKGCMEARPQPYDETDDTYITQAFTPYLYPDAVDNDWPPIDESNWSQNNGTGPNLGCGPAITPLTAEKSTVSDAIDEMLPWHRGGTLTNMGLVWGWRTLSPKWRDQWSDTDAGLPKDYDEPLMDKVVIILTDGVNQMYDHNGGGPQGSDYTAYNRRDSGVLGTSGNSAAVNEVNHRMAATCEAMKQEGIIIYTITFQLGNGGATPDCNIANGACSISPQNLFRRCATSNAHFFNSPSNAELSNVFRKIGNELSNLRIVE